MAPVSNKDKVETPFMVVGKLADFLSATTTSATSNSGISSLYPEGSQFSGSSVSSADSNSIQSSASEALCASSGD